MGQRFLQIDQFECAGRLPGHEFHQQIDIAVRSVMADGSRPEQAQRADAITSAQSVDRAQLFGM